jgi:hypothetical protein
MTRGKVQSTGPIVSHFNQERRDERRYRPMKLLQRFGVAALCAVLFAYGAYLLPNPAVSQGMQQITNLVGTEQVPLQFPCTVSCYATSATLAGFGNAQPSRNNILVGGDASTNLFQRGTTGASVTTTLTYGGPDRWAYWSGTSTAMTVSRDSTAGDLPASGYQYAFKMARTSGQTGVVQVCMAQVVETVNSYQFAGTTAELDFHATAGANFSAAASSMTAYIVTGTGADEGAASLAKGLNGGGGGSAGWTGQANATAAVIAISATNTRYAAVATIPTTATEIAVALCFTPVGTAGTNDYIAFSGIQLVRNNALASKASATVGYSCATINCTGFDRRSVTLETLMQERYYWQWAETVSSTADSPFMCAAQSTTVAVCKAVAHVPFRAAPTIACTVGTLKRQVAGTDTAVSACAAAATTNGVSGVDNVTITATVASGDTAGLAGTLMSGNSTGGGLITASAEL